jgi:hypothetical protein
LRTLIVTVPYGGNHYGGSCQVGFSIDKGMTFRVVRSYEGNCPHRNGGEDPAGQQFPFTVPFDLPNGEALFAWTWNNREQEFFMNCAVVNITGLSENNSSPPSLQMGYQPTITSENSLTTPVQTKVTYVSNSDCSSMKKKRVETFNGQQIVPRYPLIPFNQRPLMLISDIGNGCSSPKTTAELKYPNPGPDVMEGDGEYPLQLPAGSCD